MGDVFSTSYAREERDSRVVRVTRSSQRIRIRAVPLWVGLHWVERSILCAGKACRCCETGLPVRRYAMTVVDRPEQTLAVLQLTEGDLCKLARLDGQQDLVTRIGSQYRIWRPGERRPLEAEFLGFTENLITISKEMVMVDVLRIHGIRASEADVRDGGFLHLVQLRAAEVSRGERLSCGT